MPYQNVKKCDYRYVHSFTPRTLDRQTDGQTDGILVKCYRTLCMLTRDRNSRNEVNNLPLIPHDCNHILIVRHNIESFAKINVGNNDLFLIL